MRTTAAPDTKLLPSIVNVWLLFDPGTGLGDTLLIDGGVDVEVAWTWKLKTFDVLLSGLITCADHVAVVFVKFALIDNWLLLT